MTKKTRIITAVITVLVIATGVAAFCGYIIPPLYSSPADKTVNAGDTVIEQSGRRITVEKEGKLIWSLPGEVLAQDFLFDDIDGDGQSELLVLCWKRGRYGKHRPTWVKSDEIKAMTDDEFKQLMDAEIRHDSSECVVNTYKQQDKAQGLEQVLYRCAFCGALYTTKGEGNDFTCSACGRTLHFDESYHFTDDPFTIGEYYARIAELEKRELPELSLRAEVDTVIYSEKGRFRTKEKGVCTLTPEGFAYSSENNSFSVGFDLLPALPFSCSKEFETYHDEKLFYFYPTENRIQVARWALIVDIIKELADEKQN